MDYITKRRYSRIASLALYAALLAYLTLTTLMSPSIANVWVIVGAKTLPLLLFLPSMIRQQLQAMIWLSFLLLLYLIFAVLMTTTEGWIMTVLIGALFMAVVLHIRWHNRANSNTR